MEPEIPEDDIDSTEEANNLDLTALQIEGIRERLEEMIEEDIYHRYGELIAKGYLKFDSDLMNDKTELTKIVSKFVKSVSSTLS